MIAAPNVIYLASKSPRRRELLRQIGVHFELLLLREKGERLDVDEAPLPDELPRDYVMRVVRLKAEAAYRSMRDRKLPERAILTADTTVTLDAAILGKPVDRADAVRMLEKLSGQTHQVLTAVAVADAREVREALSTSFVTFEKMSADEIKRYVETGRTHGQGGRLRRAGPGSQVHQQDFGQLLWRDGPAALRNGPALATIGIRALRSCRTVPRAVPLHKTLEHCRERADSDQRDSAGDAW